MKVCLRVIARHCAPGGGEGCSLNQSGGLEMMYILILFLGLLGEIDGLMFQSHAGRLFLVYIP